MFRKCWTVGMHGSIHASPYIIQCCLDWAFIGCMTSMLNSKAVQDYDSYSVHIDYFEILWLQYTSEHILNHLSTVDYNMIWLWLQYNTVVVFNHIIIQQSFHFDVHFGLQIMKAWWIAPLLSQFTINFWSQIRNNKIFEIILAPFTKKMDWPQTQLHLEQAFLWPLWIPSRLLHLLSHVL